MTFKLTEKSEVETIWFMNGAHGNFDVLAMLWRPSPEEPWRMQWRFRHYDPKDTEKTVGTNWYEATYRKGLNEADLLKTAKRHWQSIISIGMATGVVPEVDSINGRGLSVQQLLEEMSKKSWCRMREEYAH